jgi:HPr kinase/phosphorylase
MRVADLDRQYAPTFKWQLVAGHEGLQNAIIMPECERPGLGLAGYEKGIATQRILIFGPVEMDYIQELSSVDASARLHQVLIAAVPAVVVTDSQNLSSALTYLCEELQIPLFLSDLKMMDLMEQLMTILSEEFAPTSCCHGSFVEVFGTGVLIQGESAVGKSEAALGLIAKGHRLIADDFVKVRKLNRGVLEGFGVEVTRHYMEVRGIGFVHIPSLYGAACVEEKKSLDIVVKLEVWDDNRFYDRAGLERTTLTLLGIEVPYHVLPVKPGCDNVLLLETIVLNYRLIKAGFHAPQQLDSSLLAVMEEKNR